MENLMKAICLTTEGVKVRDVPQPATAQPEHLIVKMEYCAINPGDIAFISRPLPPGAVISLYDVYGVSGTGRVIETGAGVPEAYKGRQVTVYRSLKASDQIVGTWCELAHLHFLDCAILPDNVRLEDYSGSLVNIITPYAFLKTISAEGDKGILSTAGTSATGIAMLGICLANDFPLLSLVRDEAGKKQLEDLGAKNVIVQNTPDFTQQVQTMAQQLGTTAIFDGVGGEVLNKILEVLPNNSTVYTYGYLGGPTPLTFHTSILQKGIVIKGFGNFRTPTVQNPQSLEQALKDISGFIQLPHFKTKAGKKFAWEEIHAALQFSSSTGEKAILCA